VTGDESVLLMIRNTYMKRLMVLMLMVVLSIPAFVSAHDNGSKKHKAKAHTNNGKHKGWYKDGHKSASNQGIGGSKRHSKKKANAPYASGTYKKPTSTVVNSAEVKSTSGATAKKSPTTSQGGVSKGSATASPMGGSVKVATTSQGGAPKR
jgi:hypothetical protein